eukprot:PhM_4_TR10706/c0_g2_i1/m.9337
MQTSSAVDYTATTQHSMDALVGLIADELARTWQRCVNAYLIPSHHRRSVFDEALQRLPVIVQEETTMCDVVDGIVQAGPVYAEVREKVMQLRREISSLLVGGSAQQHLRRSGSGAAYSGPITPTTHTSNDASGIQSKLDALIAEATSLAATHGAVSCIVRKTEAIAYAQADEFRRERDGLTLPQRVLVMEYTTLHQAEEIARLRDECRRLIDDAHVLHCRIVELETRR